MMFQGSHGCSRRHMLRSLVGGSILLPGILSDVLAASEPASVIAAPDPLAPKPSHYAPKAKRVIFLYLSGGVSHVDSFDPKPKLIQGHNKKAPNGQFLK